MSQPPSLPPLMPPAPAEPVSNLIRLAGHTAAGVYFSRGELSSLLQLYSRRVATGAWRDYAIDHQPGVATFSIYRCSLDCPVYRVEKVSRPAGYLLRNGRQMLTRGERLSDVLDLLEDEPVTTCPIPVS